MKIDDHILVFNSGSSSLKFQLFEADADTSASALLVSLVAAGSGILIPMLAYRISLQAAGSQGAALGKQTAAASLGQGLGSAGGGWLFGVAIGAPFWLAAALLLVGALIGLVASRRLPATAE